MSGQGELKRLEQALEIWLEYDQATERPDPDALLAAHENLRDLLEPLLHTDDSEEPADTPGLLQPGSEFEDYRIVRHIGRGGMGIVVEARQKSLDRRVAIKAMVHHGGQRATAVARFRREALTAARLHHPNIVRIITVGSTQDLEWFAMELVDGPNLDEFATAEREADPEGCLRTFVQLMITVCRALEHAHLADVIHRDVKPANILIRPDRTPALSDFGLSRLLDLPSITASKGFAGTPAYISPEQLRGESALVGPRSDVFSAGVTLYELITGRRPFVGESTQEVLTSILHRDPPSPRVLDAEIPRDLASVLMKSLEKDPAHRYVSANAFAEDLQRFLQHRPVAARHIGRAQRALRWVRRDRVRQTAALLLLLTVTALTGLGVYVFRNDSATETGQRILMSDEVEELFLASITAQHNTPEAEQTEENLARSLVRRAFELKPTDPYVACVRLYQVSRRGGSKKVKASAKQALAFLETLAPEVRQHQGVLRMEREIRERMGDEIGAQATAARIRPPDCALSYYISADQALTEFSCTPGDPGQAEKALELANRAVMLSNQPRGQYLLLLCRAAIAARDMKTRQIACDSLVKHWPRSITAWVQKVHAHIATDLDAADAACREAERLAPRSFHVLTARLQFQRVQGNAMAASATLDTLQRLYPKRTAVMERRGF